MPLRTARLACLPWYDLPEIRPATDGFWRGVRRHLAAAGLVQAPEDLEHDVDHDAILERDDLLLSQTCGLMAVGPAREHVRVVATPCYSAPGCRRAEYRSFVVVHGSNPARGIEDLAGLRCTINEPYSHSGNNVLRLLLADHRESLPETHEPPEPSAPFGPFFSSVSVSGSHFASLEQVALGGADVAAIDCISYELLRRHRPDLVERVRIVLATGPGAAPPFVTSRSTDEETLELLRGALADAVRDPELAPHRAELLLEGLEVHSLRAYEPMLFGELRALRVGLGELVPGHGLDDTACEARGV